MLTHLLDTNSTGLLDQFIELFVNKCMKRVQGLCLNEYNTMTATREVERQSIMPYTVATYHNVSNQELSAIVFTTSYAIEVFLFVLSFGPKTSVKTWQDYETTFQDGWRIPKFDPSKTNGAIEETFNHDKYNVFSWPPGKPVFLSLCERGGMLSRTS